MGWLYMTSLDGFKTLPVPEEHKPKDDTPMFRCDDRGQGQFLFE